MEMSLNDIYDVMHIYALRNRRDVRGDEDACSVSFKTTIDGEAYTVYMKTEYFGTINHVEVSFPRRVELSKMKEASRVINEINGRCRYGAFRVVEHNGILRYCLDTVLKNCKVDTSYFAEVSELAVATVKRHAATLSPLCE